MYKPYLILALCLSLLATQQSCRKDHDQPRDADPLPSWGDLLDYIEWNNGSKNTFAYNTDSTLKQIVYSFGSATHSYEFSWSGKKPAEVHDNLSIYKQTYHYNGNKVSHINNAPKNGSVPGSYKMEYTYNANGKVDKLNYLIINEAGTEVKAGTTYYYNAAGELIKTVTFMDNSIVTQTIDGYSPEVAFNPWAFMDLTLLENYMIFNYPVLSTMKGYPVKITRTVQIGNDPAFVDFTTTNTCEINNKRITRLTTEFKNPTMPGYDRTSVANFVYK